MAVAIYARVSTEEQRERQSIRTQLEFADRYCQLHTLATYKIYSDDGISGTVPLEKRPEGSEILEDARQEKFDQLLVYRLDRLGRDTRLILNAVAELEKLGVRVRSMTEDFDTGTATGRLMLTMLSGFASHERDVIRERSVAGTMRVAEGGAWLGGIVPYGYRKQGEKRDARLVVSEEPIPGVGRSEAEVVRDVFRLSAGEHKSCYVIADWLNQVRVPCAYVRDDRHLLRGKRRERTSGKWSPGRVRNMLVSKTYKGLHEFGKRSTSGRPILIRPCPAIVTEETWKKAQDTLAANFLFCKRSALTQYLLRGLIKCSLCGLTYIGTPGNLASGKQEFYYRCNGANARGRFGKLGKRCPSKAVRGDRLEATVWADVQSFLRDPGSILEQLRAKFEADAKGTHKLKDQLSQLESLVAEKTTERGKVLGLYRRGRLDDADLDRQLDEIAQEEAGLKIQLAELAFRMKSSHSVNANVGSAETLLTKLRKRLEKPVSWETQRQLVEVLVGGIAVDTVEEHGVAQPKVTVRYRFEKPNEIERSVTAEEELRAPIRIPVNPETVGDHIRLRRLQRKLRQKDLATKLGVDTTSIHNWESNLKEPGLQFIPGIIEFLGYNPLPPATTWAERLIRYRKTLGMTQKLLARALEVDPTTLSRWERGEREPAGSLAARAERVLASVDKLPTTSRLVG